MDVLLAPAHACQGGPIKTGDTMNWSDLTRDWADSYRALRSEFPHLEPSAMPFLKGDQCRFESYLAATHDMSLKEAQEAFDAFLEKRAERLLA